VPDVVRDPVHRVRYAFTPEGDDVLVDCWLEPGARLPEHRHPRQEEEWWVVEGSARVTLDGKARTMVPADGVLLVRAHARHALASAGPGEAHLRCRVRPALGLQAFLTESAAGAREGLIRTGGIPRSLRGARWGADLLARHGDDVVMSFPPPPVQRAMVALLGRRGGRAG
jgi:hypothetical protein